MIPVLLTLAVCGTVSLPTGVDVLFPAFPTSVRLRVEVTDDHPPLVTWAVFLNALFDHFDRDGDGALSSAEAGRVFPLPLPGGREAKVDFTRADADLDGRLSRVEFRKFCRSAGFAPAVVVVQPPTAEQLRLAGAVFNHLDRDGDGKLSRAELKQAGELLRRFDDNEDEVLDPAELLASEPLASPPSTRVQSASASGTPDGVLRVYLGKRGAAPTLEAKTARVEAGKDARRITIPGGRISVGQPAVNAGGGFLAAKEFHLAQFAEAVGRKAGLRKADAESDPTLQTVVGLFDAADRDSNRELTAAELTAFLDLIDRGVQCQAVVTIEEQGANLYDLLDANGDGRLDAAELRTAADLPPVERAAVPTQYRFTASRGLSAVRFGPVAVPAVKAKPAVVATPPAGGPRWFRAMDRNGNGFVSAAEFRGPPEAFKKLDGDGDGRISVIEAGMAGR